LLDSKERNLEGGPGPLFKANAQNNAKKQLGGKHEIAGERCGAQV